MKAPKYPTLESLAGVAGTLDEPLSMAEMLRIAREDALDDKYRVHPGQSSPIIAAAECAGDPQLRPSSD